ncbi:hypothetical protein C1645_811826 [Glomus cerebriforme]|uniref:Uncharacterized protein n=1 Tax=Glomus cerebriforme TaxID=658196 RepID=A0A397TV99_9GLOM|nr:hypothetical protein C1645_811826 [Glomus cerebriforme]
MINNNTRKQAHINKLVREKFVLQIINRKCKAEADLAEFNRSWVFNQYQKWKAREINSWQIIIINLQNNLLLENMAEARRQPLYDIIVTTFSKYNQYTGQEPPNEYLDKIWNSVSYLEPNMTALENANVGDFNDTIKFAILKSKLGGKYIPVPNNDPYTSENPAINSPATLQVWINAKYQCETVGRQQVAIQRLTQERFLPTDSSDIHLSGDLFTWIRIANPEGQNYQNNSSTEIDKLNAKIAFLEAQLAQVQVQLQNNDVLDRMHILAGRLEILLDVPKDTSDIESLLDPNILSNDGMDKRLEQIKTHLAKLTRKDTRAKLIKDSKSKSGQVHMTTAYEQSDPIFSDDNISKPKDNDYNSDMKCNECAEQSGYFNKFSSFKAFNQPKGALHKVEQNDNSSPAHNQVKKCEPEPISTQDLDDESIDDLIEIDFVQKEELSTSIASIKCKIGYLKILAMALDSCSEITIITKDIVLRIEVNIDKSIKYGIATMPVESIGVVHNLPITLAPGFTIYEDFIVVKYSKPMLIFSNPLLKKYKCAIDWDKDELKIFHNGKDYIILVIMHKIKNKLEVNCANIISEYDDFSASDKISQDSQDISDVDILKKYI